MKYQVGDVVRTTKDFDHDNCIYYSGTLIYIKGNSIMNGSPIYIVDFGKYYDISFVQNWVDMFTILEATASTNTQQAAGQYIPFHFGNSGVGKSYSPEDNNQNKSQNTFKGASSLPLDEYWDD